MIAGFGAYLEQEFCINSVFGSAILAVLCLIIFNKDVKGFVKVNSILIPVLIVIVVFIGVLNFKNLNILNLDHYLIQDSNNNWEF